VSKRPKTANAVMSRLRRPVGRLRDLPIWSKLGLIMLVPTLATIIVGTSGLIDHINEASNAERARTLAALSQASGGLVDQLQNERAYAVTIWTTNGEAQKKAIATYRAEWGQVEATKLPYAQQRAALDNVKDQPKINLLLSKIDNNLKDLPTVRTQASRVVGNRSLDTDGIKDIKGPYDVLINDLLTVRDVAAQLADDTTLSDHMRAAAAVARAKDYVTQQREVGHEAVGTGDFTVGLRREYLLTDTGYQLATETLTSVGTDAEQQLFERTVSGPNKVAATSLTVPLINLQGANTKHIPFTHETWDTAMVGYNALFRNVENRLDAGIVSEATDLRDNTNQRVFLETSVLLGMLLLAILFAWLVARSMARSLRELRQGALSVAQFGLPHAVRRLQDPSLHGSLTPAQVADQVAEPLPVRSRDEFGQVTEAFNAVHLEAVRTAAEQAALRSSVATMFVNLARRSQILVDRLIGHLDRLERGEEDPDRLAELFQLDHLATRMRRNDENLLVLAGADSTRVQREPAALIDVLRAAQSEVEHYTRIEFGMIDRDIEVSAHAVNDMVHLVAELFDNATAFSPPNSTVLVEARRLGEGAILSVEDRGIGISREQLRDLNERLANPPMVDVAVSRMMGLVVVARLANRHGVKVELRPSDSERGTVADVGLPSAVLVVSSMANRLQQQPGLSSFPAAEQQSRPSFPEPLALESGRGGYPGGRPFDPNPPMPTGGMLGTGAGRSVPSWSDLTGAPGNGGFTNGGFSNGGFPDGVNGSNGANGFHGPRSNEVIPPLPQGPQDFGDDDGLPQRRNGDAYRPDGDTGFGGSHPRQLPGHPESQTRSPFVPPPVSAPPVPAPPPYGGGRPASPVSGPPVSAPPVPSAPPSSAPPAWPPVSERDAPSVPESLAAALDMTAEIPRYRPDRTGSQPQLARPDNPSAQQQMPTQMPPAPPSDAQRAAAAAAAAHEMAEAQAAAAQATAAAQIAAAQAAAQQRASGESDTRYADETMELPIFRELESAWFTTAKPATQPAGQPVTEDDLSPVTTQRFSTGEPARSAAAPQPVSAPESPDYAEESRDRDPATVGASASNGSSNGNGATSPWQTAADEGWQAARLAAEAPVDTTTTAGLPKRTPMAQLVPGGVDRGGNSVQRRTPEAVRGLLSAYHRGVQRGRQSTNPEETSGGQQSSQAGKEHEA
jgi:signal transduction histidine kinase